MPTSTTVPIQSAAAGGGMPGWAVWLRQAWDRLMLDDDTRFLSEARDHADLERRLRRLERGREHRFDPLPPL